MCTVIKKPRSRQILRAIAMSLTVAGDGEGCNVSGMILDKHSDQCDIEDHTLHQHPHERDKEPVVEKNSHQSTSNWNYLSLS